MIFNIVNVHVRLELINLALQVLEQEGNPSLLHKLAPYANASDAMGERRGVMDLRTVFAPSHTLLEVSEFMRSLGYREWAAELAQAAQTDGC